MKTKSVRVRCKSCKGRGSIELSGVYRDTLELLRSQESECTGAQLALISGCKAPAMNNRLFRVSHARRVFA
jgi:hypothetical protein